MKKKRTINKNFIFICTALFMVSIAGSRPLIPLYADELGASHVEIGVIVALFSFFPLFLSIKLGKMIDSIGVKGPLIASILFGILSMVILSIFHNLSGVYISQIFAGLAQLVFVLSMQAYSGQFSKSKLREYYITVFSIALAAGSFAGPLLSGFLTDSIGYSPVFLTLGCVLVGVLPFSLFFSGKKVLSIQHKSNEGSSLQLLRIPDLRKAVLVSSIGLLAKDMYIAFFPLLATENGLPASTIGVIIALNAGAGMFIRGFLPWISQHLKRDVIITISIAISGVIYILNPLFNHALWLSILSIVLGFCTGICQPLSIFATIIALPKERVAEGLGLRLTFNKLTQIVGPLSLGSLSSVVGMPGIFYACGVIILMGSFHPDKLPFYRGRKSS
ncbi:MFS transporter [Ureibacillus aquaedulcis]|uniref:MFS transporter n=1 Tax=Ureibacillus aquaedulcis TaxID=3058421 RepID=A0ABT8GW09_9BACL|nr:MFS transporter [Ureibacillus sp. BA0131]MDN4495605.1 MFS transporter [Ureibacillus sp. BA0131]